MSTVSRLTTLLVTLSITPVASDCPINKIQSTNIIIQSNSQLCPKLLYINNFVSKSSLLFCKIFFSLGPLSAHPTLICRTPLSHFLKLTTLMCWCVYLLFCPPSLKLHLFRESWLLLKTELLPVPSAHSSLLLPYVPLALPLAYTLPQAGPVQPSCIVLYYNFTVSLYLKALCQLSVLYKCYIKKISCKHTQMSLQWACHTVIM